MKTIHYKLLDIKLVCRTNKYFNVYPIVVKGLTYVSIPRELEKCKLIKQYILNY